MAPSPISDQTAQQLREAWFRYLDTVEPLRPSLYRYCRRMTRDIWDAEDLLQETLLKGFGEIGRGDLRGEEGAPVQNSRAYIFRIATNIWIDQVRRAEIRRTEDVIEPSSEPAPSVATREAASMLLVNAAPQQRAAVVLKDVFDFTLEEIAQMLSTTVGAIKSALHRGRASLKESSDMKPSHVRAPSKELLDRFVEAFASRDVNLVTELLLENVTLEVPGVGGTRGKSLVWVRSSLDLPTPNNPQPAHREFMNEVVLCQSQWIVVTWQRPRSASILAGVNRFEEEDGRIAKIWEYHFCPETIAEVAGELGAKPLAHGYHQPPDILSRMIASTVLPWSST
jgi:RNA polymerase sigma-70 factor, ECF subfamily